MKRNNVSQIVFSLLCGTSLLVPGIAHAQKKPATKSTKPGAVKPQAAKPAAKPAQATGPIVLGTTQLPGDFGKFGQTYTIGQNRPINFTLTRAEYSVNPVTIGNNSWAPKTDEKVLILHYTVHNPLPQEVNYDWSGLRFTVVDGRDTNHDYIQCVAREGMTDAPLSINLKPAQKLEVYAAVIVPADGVTPKLMVEREKGAPVIRYDLRGNVKPLMAPYADPADTTGMTAAKEVPAKAGEFYPVGAFDMRLESVAYTSAPLLRREPGKGNRWMTVIFTIKNRSNRARGAYWSDFLPEAKDADGEKLNYPQALLKATRDEVSNGELAPGEEGRIRFFFPIPEGVTGKTLKISQGTILDARVSRPFVFDLTTASPATTALSSLTVAMGEPVGNPWQPSLLVAATRPRP